MGWELRPLIPPQAEQQEHDAITISVNEARKGFSLPKRRFLDIVPRSLTDFWSIPSRIAGRGAKATPDFPHKILAPTLDSLHSPAVSTTVIPGPLRRSWEWLWSCSAVRCAGRR